MRNLISRIEKAGDPEAHSCDVIGHLLIKRILKLIAIAVLAPITASAQTFNDVPTDYWAYGHIETLYESGITSGCAGGNYCPADPVTRAQMAVFLERGMKGSNYVPGPANGNVFTDVGAGDFAANFIEQLFSDGITGGCGNNNYCPDAQVTRDQMAVFLLRAKHGSGYSPPAATGVFGDVPLNYWAVHWIEQLAAEGITAGCAGGNYCPEEQVTRDQMAVFLVRAFGLDRINAPALETSTPTSNGDISLTWTFEWGGGLASTANGYSLEQSTSPSTGFTEIYSTVNGNDRQSPKTYSFTHTEPGSYTLYYRVRARLFNQTWSDYSNTVSVSVTRDNQLDYIFAGGTIADLRAVSPTLSFGNLTFTGRLTIPSSESSIVISVANFTMKPISNAVGVAVSYPTCDPYWDAPNLTINASGDVALNDSINLRGKNGVSIATGATCNSPFGTRGGSLEINARNITVNGRIDTSGGRSSTESMIIAGQVIRLGYDGRDAGNIGFNATSNLNLTGNADLDAAGGSGGVGSIGNIGADGVDGQIHWAGSPINAAEIDSLNALQYNAQRIPYGRLSIQGTVGLSDDSQFRGSSTSGWCQINYNNGFSDFIEDFYRIDLGGTSARSMSVVAASTSDIDIFLLDTCGGTIIGFGGGATGNESISTQLLQPGTYFLGVSYADDAPSGVNASYSVTLGQ